MNLIGSFSRLRMSMAALAALTAVSALPVGPALGQTRPTPTPTVAPAQQAGDLILTPTPRPDYYDRLPKDSAGRVFGFPIAPVLNYTTTMITGKPCRRVTSWKVRQVVPEPPAKPFGAYSDPCVVQNALDDTLAALFFYPFGHSSSKDYREQILPMLSKDPVAKRVFEQQSIKMYTELTDPKKRDWRIVCDKPVYLLLDADKDLPVYFHENSQKYWTRNVHMKVYMAAGNAEPFTCKWYDAKTGEVFWETGAREQDMIGPIDSSRSLVKEMWLFYRPNLRRWVWVIMGNPLDPLTNYRERVLALLDKSPIKP